MTTAWVDKQRIVEELDEALGNVLLERTSDADLIRESRGDGGPSGDPVDVAYEWQIGRHAHSLFERQAEARRIREKLKDLDLSPATRVRVGACFLVLDIRTGKEQVYLVLLACDRSDFMGCCLITPDAPLCQAIMGKAKGDEAVVTVPSGTKTMRVLSVY